jgi:hypothetical protein
MNLKGMGRDCLLIILLRIKIRFYISKNILKIINIRKFGIIMALIDIL